MNKIPIAAFASAAAWALCACGPGDKEPPGQGPEATGAPPGAFQLQPGKYRTNVHVEKIEIPGMPIAMADQMKAMMGKAAAEDSCITPERAARGHEVFKQQIARGKCRFERFQADAGKLDSAFICQTGDGMTMEATSRGTYSSSGSEMRTDARLTGPDGKTMHVVQTVKAQRIGDCS